MLWDDTSHKLQSLNRTERLLDLITYLLNAQEPVSWQEIKNHFPDDYARGVEESNQRKFERDKAELIALGIPIDYQNGSEIKKEGYVVQKERLFLPEIHFSPQEFSLLMLSASAVLENESFPYRDQLETSLHKIISLQRSSDPPPSQIKITYLRDETGSGSRSPWLPRIQDALERRKWVRFRYYAFTTGQTSERRVDPYGLIFRKGNWTLIGWDHLREDIRSFVVIRIQKLEVNPRRPGTPDYEIAESFSLQHYLNQQPWEYDFHEPIDVRIRITPHRVPELRPQLASAKQLSGDIFQLRVSNRGGLVSWLLSQKTDVRVLEPAQIQEDLRTALKTLI